MKLPRWLVIGMLTSSVLAVLAAAGWWWVTWPERTAREFVNMIGAERLDDAKNMLRSQYDPWKVVSLEFDEPAFGELADQASWKKVRLECHSRTALNILWSHQEFYVPEADFTFTVFRGKLVIPESYAFWAIGGGPIILLPRVARPDPKDVRAAEQQEERP